MSGYFNCPNLHSGRAHGSRGGRGLSVLAHQTTPMCITQEDEQRHCRTSSAVG
jgi:hypothetical protein